MKTATKLLSVLLCGAMALSLAGCHLSSPSTVLNVDGEDVSAGLYLLYQLQAYSSATDKQTDKTVNVLKDTIEEKTGEDWVHDETVRLVRRYSAINKMFDEQGLTLTDDEKTAAASQAQSGYTSSEAVYSKNGIGQESYSSYYLNETKYDKLLTAYIEENDATVTNAQAMAYMDKTYAHVSMLMLPTTDVDGAAVSDDVLAQIQTLADELEKKLAADGSMEEEAEATLKKAFELCGMEYTDESLSQYEYTTFVSEGSSYFDAATTTAMMDAKVGAAAQSTYGNAPMVWQKVANYEDEKSFEASYRDTLVQSILQEQFDEVLASAGEAYTVTEDASAVKTYSPKKVVTA